jgi:NAD dependent epimerase/dehydratase family enzyme
VRAVLLRLGVVLAPDGGALGAMLLPFRAGLGGPLGGGKQWMSWVHRDDVVGLIRDAVVTESYAGPVNATSPNPVTNRDFTRALGRAVHRPGSCGCRRSASGS